MGFQGDVTIGTKDIAAALKVGLSPAPPPLFVRPNLIGFSAASKAGLALSDLAVAQRAASPARELDTAHAAGRLAAQPVPAVLAGDRPRPVPDAGRALQRRPLRSATSRRTRRRGDRSTPTAAARSTSTPRRGRAACDRKADGCLASVYGRLDSGGLVAGGELNELRARADRVRRHVGARSRSRRPSSSCALKGGVRIATDDYEFASGRADLDISRDGFNFSGDAALFNDAFHGYLKATAPFDLDEPVVQRRGVAARGRSRRDRQRWSATKAERAPAGDRRRSASC